MKVVQIVGPSYSGSTALGFMLNTKRGWYFGSEVYRFLKTHRDNIKKEGGKEYRPRCGICKKHCDFWTEELREDIFKNNVDSLQEVYELICHHHPEVGAFVDGSKTYKWYKDNEKDFQIISVKHPLRLLASFFYNQRAKFELEDDLLSVRKSICGNLGKYIDDIDQRLVSYLDIYRSSSTKFPDSFFCRVDELHLENFFHFKEMCGYLGESFDDFSPCSFSSVPVHPVGGNSAPHWQVEKKDKVIGSGSQRFEYYKSAPAIGDYKIDNKFLVLFDEDVVIEVSKLSSYKELCLFLGYSSYPNLSV